MNTSCVVAIGVIAAQAAVITRMGYDRSYGCLTRASFDMLYPILKASGFKFIAGDVDNFKSHNGMIGHEAVNRLVKTSIRTFRWTGQLRIPDLVFRVYSGDEFIIATLGNPFTIASRVMDAFSKQGMSLTTDIIDQDLETSMSRVLRKKESR